LQTLPETLERTQREVDMLIALGPSLITTQGYAAPEVEQSYFRAQHLCRHLDNPHQFFSVLCGLWNYYFVRAELQTAHTLGEQLLDFAQQAQDPARLVAAHHILGSTLSHLGAVASAHTHFAQGIALYDSQQHRAAAFLDDPGVACRSRAALTLWYLGYPDQGLARSHETLLLAQQRAHPFSLTYFLGCTALLHQFRREGRFTQEHAEATIRLATDQGYPHWKASGTIQRGWALVHQGQVRDGVTQLTQGLRAFRATGAELTVPHHLALLAEAYSMLGEPETGLGVLTEALALVDTTGERWYEPELYRLKGELLLQQHVDNQAEAESCFHHALAIARHHQAKSFELRTATSLARLWQQQGKRQEAYDLLAPVYGWFTEGFDTADLQESKALLEALA